MTHSGRRPRARGLGIAPGSLPSGPLCAITDVPGVRVGQVTLVKGSDIRTGVTAVVPDTLAGGRAGGAGGTLPAGLFVGNGYGKMTGTTQLTELGVIETPLVLTGTLSVFRAADALVSYMLALPGNENMQSVNPVVAETNDGFLSDIRRRSVAEGHVLAALRAAAGGPVAEGAVGGGTGMSALGFKAGIGTASRRVTCGGQVVTLGALVQANFSGTLTVLGVPVPRERADAPDPAAPDPDVPGNSCVIILATDAPLDARRLRRVAWRAMFGMSRTGSDFADGSGDYSLAFSTAPADVRPLPDSALDPLFAAAAEVTEEAILNSVLGAETMTGFRGHVSYGVPPDRVRRLCAARGVLAQAPVPEA